MILKPDGILHWRRVSFGLTREILPSRLSCGANITRDANYARVITGTSDGTVKKIQCNYELINIVRVSIVACLSHKFAHASIKRIILFRFLTVPFYLSVLLHSPIVAIFYFPACIFNGPPC